MSFLNRLFGRTQNRDAVLPLYQAIIAEARRPEWYATGGVADSVEGRFEAIMVTLSLIMIRLEALGSAAAETSVLLTETFVNDMDGQLRQQGIGDIVVGKHIGKMMSALGGRLGVYRAGFVDGIDLDEALIRNLYRGEETNIAALAFMRGELMALQQRLGLMTFAELQAGQIGA